MQLPADLEIALEAADRASRLIRDHYARSEPIPDAPADISTATDHAAQELILQHLRQAFPADGLCAEEATATLASASTANGRVWVVDPIDGTRGFARKNGEFSVMIALRDAGGIALGVVQEPARGRVTFAWRGGGCWERTVAARVSPCRVSTAGRLAEATLTQSHSRGPGPSKVARLLGPRRVVETYSAGVKLARVARGEADIYVNTYAAFHDWDVCAGELLVAEAGGRVTDLRGGAIRYGAAGWKQAHGLLASNGALHAAALESLESLAGFGLSTA
jgi:3'(2'), 5'-bisphosphate nucleotidase